ncbi:MAG: UDP-N-acetylmuramoyl-L-alanine--D-glutamate ligase [Pseudomonadota bacterium]
MIPVTTCNGQHIAVFGLGRSGIATCHALRAGGAEVAAWDDNPAARELAERESVALCDLDAADWSSFHALVLAPGVPLTHPVPHWTVQRAQANDVEVIGDVELFCRERRRVRPDAPFVAITGTNGKSTTTALTAHVLRAGGRNAQVGGNIGVPILSLAALDSDAVYVIEMSSYQIDLTPSLAPSIGMLLNVSPDHIDRHGTFEAYAAIKERLVAASAIRLISVDDPASAAIHGRLATQNGATYAISVGGGQADVMRDGAAMIRFGEAAPANSHQVRLTGGPFEVSGIPTLRGRHNLQNAMAAVATARLLSPPLEGADIQSGLATFPGLPHRMEQIASRGRVVFINDSKATNADSAARALSAFDGHVFWIAGGRPKEGGIAGLRDYFPVVRRAYLIGEAASEFAATIGDAIDAVQLGTLEDAVRMAAADAAQCSGAEPVVLLSPACASFDQFRSFEVRGDAFRSAVAGIPGVILRPRGTV